MQPRAFLLAVATALALGLMSLQGPGDLWAAGTPAHLPPPRLKTTFKSKNAFSAILIGTNGPGYNLGRANASTMIQYQGHYFLVDMGNLAQERLARLGVSTGDIETLMFTHHHLDHDEEYIPLSITGWMSGRNHLELIGPPGTRALHEFLTTFYKNDMTYRRHASPSFSWDGMISNVDIKELHGGESLVLHGVRITTTQVPHSIYSLAYRFDADGQSIVVSGDTSYSDDLITLAQNADILVIDAGALFTPKTKPGLVPPPKPRDKPDHCTLEELAAIAHKAKVKKLVLTHFPPWPVDEKAALKEFRKTFSNEIIFGEDLLEIPPQISSQTEDPALVHSNGTASPSRWSPRAFAPLHRPE